MIESLATEVLVEEVIKTYYKAPPVENGDREETYEVVEFENALEYFRSASLE